MPSTAPGNDPAPGSSAASPDAPGQRLVLGIDLGGTAVKLALGDPGQPEPAWHTARSADHDRPSATQVVDAIAAMLGPLLASAGATPSDLAAVGLSVAGPIDPRGRLQYAANLPDLAGCDLGELGARAAGVPGRAAVLTDASAAAVAAHHDQPHPRRVIYLSLGTGVGGAVLDAGRPVTITRGTPGHFGHMDVSGGEPDAPATPGAGRGALEAYIGARGLRDAGVDLDQPIGAVLDHPAVRRGVAALARGVRVLLALYRPDRVVLMGGLALWLRPVAARLGALVRDGLTPAAPEAFDLVFADATPFAAARGAALYAAAERTQRGENPDPGPTVE